MEILSINRGTILTLISMLITLAVVATVFILMRLVKKRNNGILKRNWFYYSSQFIIFGGVMFFFCRFTTFDWKRDLLTSVIGATVYTLCIFLSDRKHKNK